MYKMFQRPDGSFRFELDFKLIEMMTDEKFRKYFNRTPHSLEVIELLQRIKEKQALDKELPPKKRKLDRISF